MSRTASREDKDPGVPKNSGALAYAGGAGETYEAVPLRLQISDSIDSADRVEAAMLIAEAKSTDGIVPIAAVSTYCNGEGFLEEYYDFIDVAEIGGRFYLNFRHFKELNALILSGSSRRELKNVSKKYSIKKKEASYTDGDITIVRATSRGRDGQERLSDKLYYRAVITQEPYGRRDINFPLKGQVRSDCFKEARRIRSAIESRLDLIELLEKYHPKSKLTPKLKELKTVEVEVPAVRKKLVKKLPLKVAIEKYLQTKREKNRSVNTIRQATEILGKFTSYCGDKYLEDITEEDAENFLATEPPSNSFNHYYRAVNGLFRWAIKKKHIRLNPCFCLEMREREAEEVAVLTWKECVALLDAARRLYDGEMLAYVAITIFGALRPDSEMRHLSWDRINLEDEEIRVVKGKRNVKRTIEMPSNLVAWLKICDNSKPIYPKNFRRKMAAVRRAAGFKGGTKVSTKQQASEANRKPWVKDYARHTGISCHVREFGDTGKTATWAGTSEEVIKTHYLGLVTGSEAKKFWSIMP